MYVYKKQTEGRKAGQYQVGYFNPDGEFCTSSRHSTPEKARRRVNYLNGGPVPRKTATAGHR